MSISSTGIYGNTSILNSEIYTDIINDIEDINTNKIPNLILDISENRFDISQNRTDIILDRQRGLTLDVLRIFHEDTFITVELT